MQTAILSFDTTHPAFPGHFPGRPIVPGVLLLDGVQRAVEAACGQKLTGIAAAKFLSPALPGDVLTVEYDLTPAAVAFTIRCGTRLVSNGRFHLDSGGAP